MNTSESIAPPLESRTSLPENIFPLEVLKVFDSVSSQVLILDDSLHIRYFNPHYYNKYRLRFIANNVQDEDILNLKLDAIHKNAPVDKSVKVLQRVIKTRQSITGYFFNEEDTLYQGFSNITYISMPSFTGLSVVQDERKEIEDFSRQINNYRKLIDDIGKNAQDKSDLPLYFRNITGISTEFVKILHQGALVAPTSSSVCIFGESGTGKEVFANAIHYSSPYSQGPFIKVNCSAIPETLIESELFGYEKGAFTGANPNGSPGKFELANNGTLFLDEIGELPMSMQAKLLRAIQEREITRIGGKKTIKLNFRLITATNRDLEKMIREGEFREDLYYRICIIPINLPPLRERRSDISLLANEFLEDVIARSPIWKSRQFSEEVLNAFYRYNWPGNIRELKNCVERMAVFSTTEQIEIDVLPANIDQSINADYQKYVSGASSEFNLKSAVEDVERRTISSVLNLTKGNKIKAIKMLGVSSRTFYEKLKKYNIN
jgi:transcriptional regulator with PAS, ATPase and Fis domain